MSIKKYLDKLEDLSGKEVLVTGGTSGIGLSLVKQLLSKNASVVVLARNMQKAEEVKKTLLETFNHPQISFIQYDQSDDESVINAAKEVSEKHPHFYAFVLNAGIAQRKRPVKYVDGYPITIKTNLIGLSLFLETLIPLLKGNHRFIFQGSLAAGWHLKKIKSYKDKDISFWQQYLISKAGVEALFYHYSKLEQNQFSFYLVEPGITGTDIIRDFSAFIRWAGKIFLKVFSHSNDKAALTALLAVQSTTNKNSFIVPRCPGTYMGYPKIKKFPKKREKQYLIDLLNKI